MKRKIIRFLGVVSVILGSFIMTSRVQAEEMVIGDYVDRIFIKKESGSVKRWLRFQWIYRSSDYKFVYCLQPWVTVEEGINYDKVYSDPNISSDVMRKVKLIAYYGYGYKNHTEDYWYAVTQMLIWRTIDPQGDFYFTDRLNGNRINVYTSEMQEINDLVNNHTKIPSFSPRLIKTSIGKEVVLNDTNQVLENFEILNKNNVIVKEEKNKLILKSDQEGTYNFDIVKRSNIYKEIPFIYISDESQNVMTVGKFDDLYTGINVRFYSGTIKLEKKDKEETNNKYLSLANAEYTVYNEENEEVGKIITDENGKGEMINLPLDKYYIKETKASSGYEIDDTIYEVDLSTEKLEYNLTVYEQQKKTQISINKVYIEEKTNQKIPESNVTFDIYEENKDIIFSSITTDENGNCSVELPFGIYVFKQRNSKEGYNKVSDFIINVNEHTDNIINKELVDYPTTKIIYLPDTGNYDLDAIYFIIPLLLLKYFIRKKHV